MRALVLYHVWKGESVADPIGVMPEIVWENIDEDDERRMWHAFKAAYCVADAPDESFRLAWVLMPDGDAMFQVPELGTARRVD